MLLLRRSTWLLREGRARAAMARPVDEAVKVIKVKSVAIGDCGASSTPTGSHINARDIEEKVTIVGTADGEERQHMNGTIICSESNGGFSSYDSPGNGRLRTPPRSHGKKSHQQGEL